jgi:hypothetical protein
MKHYVEACDDFDTKLYLDSWKDRYQDTGW